MCSLLTSAELGVCRRSNGGKAGVKMLEGFRLLLLGIGVGATGHARHVTCLQVRFGRLFRRRHRESLPVQKIKDEKSRCDPDT